MEAIIVGGAIVGASTLLSVLGLLWARRWVAASALRPHHDVAGFLLGVLGVIYAVLLAFVVIVVWEKYEDAQVNVSREANCVGDLARLGEAMPGAWPEIHRTLVDYLGAVVDDEWARMSDGDDSPRAWAKFDELWKIYRTYSAQGPIETAMYAQSVERLTDLSDNRRTRLDASRDHIPGVLWILLWGGGAVTIVFTYFFGMENVRPQLLMTAALALVVGFVLFLILALNNPFAGAVRVSADPLRYELQRLQTRP